MPAESLVALFALGWLFGVASAVAGRAAIRLASRSLRRRAFHRRIEAATTGELKSMTEQHAYLMSEYRAAVGRAEELSKRIAEVFGGST